MRRSTGRITPTRKLVKKGSSLRDLRPLTERVVLEKVLGVTVNGNSGLTCNPVSGDIAYAAGCVIVIIGSPPQYQSHIVNISRKTVSSLAFSPDGKYLVSGESGHQPAVRVWDVEDNTHPQVSEMTKGHKHGIQSVAFSPNMKYVVSVGFQHDMLVNIWNWREGTTIACNKVSSKVNAISFSEIGDYFVTVGVRLVKFWYIDSNSATKAKKKIPLLGRPAILGEQRDNQFIDVACGVGVNSRATYTVTKSGLLCSFNEKRLLDKWVELRVNGAYSLTVNEHHIFCGCSDGIIRLFNSSSLEFIGRLPKPHCLGVDVAAGLDASHLLTKVENASYPDTVALALDSTNLKLTCVYNDHSIYIWDIKDIKKIGKVSSFLYHNSCVWGVEVYPEINGNHQTALPYGSFLTCSSDGTVRVWNIETGANLVKNIYSKELMRILYTGKDLAALKDTKGQAEKNRKEPDIKPGVRCLKLCHMGEQLATGDRMGNISVFDLTFMDLLVKIEAHESEVLCIEFSIPDSGYKFLGSAGRDRLIHVFDCNNNFNLLQTIDDHSASITAIKFNVTESKDLRLISCAADKSVIFRSLQKEPYLQFTRYTNVATKTTFYDMDIHPSCNYTVTAGQDRNLRVFDISSGKQTRSFKGSMGDDGLILKVLLDRTGFYAATSCSDKSLSLYDFEMGECVAGMVGHSEIVTGLQFSVDCTRLITVSGDGCIFVWKLPSAFSQNMTERLSDQESPEQIISPNTPLRRETYDLSPSNGVVNGQDFGHVANALPNDNDYRFSMGKLPSWAKKQIANHENLDIKTVHQTIETSTSFTAAPQLAGKWAERFNQVDLKIQPESPSSVGGESPGMRRFTADVTPLHNNTEALARTPLEKRCSTGSLPDEDEIIFQDASVVLRRLKNEASRDLEGVPVSVNTSRGSDIFLQTIETRTYIESNLVNSSEQDVVHEVKEDSEIIYYPTEEDSSEVASTRLQDVSRSCDPTDELLKTNADIKPNPVKIQETINQEIRPLKKRSIEDYLRSPSECDDIGYFEIRPGHSMDDLVIHEVELASLARRRSEDLIEREEKSYDVKIRQDSDEDVDQNTDSTPRDDTDDKTADSLSDEEDLLTKEIIPKWDELSVEPAPTIDKANVENNELFLQENFQCLGSTPTDEQKEFVFKEAEEAVPTEPLPFDRNNFHRTSISARFILRSKQSSLRSTTSSTSQSPEDKGIEEKNLELEKRKEELALTKKRLIALGFTSLDKRNKNTKNESSEVETVTTTTDLSTEKHEPLRNADHPEDAEESSANDEKPEHGIQESSAPHLSLPALAGHQTSPRDHSSQNTSPEEIEIPDPLLSSKTITGNDASATGHFNPARTDPIPVPEKHPSPPHSSNVSPVKVTMSPKGTVISSFEITNVIQSKNIKSHERESSGSAFHPIDEVSKGSGKTSEESPNKRASELIAFFDPQQKQNAIEQESRPGKLHEHEPEIRKKVKSKKSEKDHSSEKVSKNLRPSKLPLNSKNDENTESRGRRSFLSGIRLTRPKGLSRRSSKGELSKTKSCNDLSQEHLKDPAEYKQRRKSESKKSGGLKSDAINHNELNTAMTENTKQKSQKDVVSNLQIQEDVESRVREETPETFTERPSVVEAVSNSIFSDNMTPESNLSELSAELNAALATPQYQPIQINLSSDYLLNGNDSPIIFKRQAAEKREFSSQITKSECREVVVDLVRAFERAMECHSKILQGDIEDDQQQVLSMLSATFSTIQESVIECKRDREQKTRTTTRARVLEQRPNIDPNMVNDKQTKESSQQTEQSFLNDEHERIIPILEKYSELLLQKIEQKINNN